MYYVNNVGWYRPVTLVFASLAGVLDFATCAVTRAEDGMIIMWRSVYTMEATVAHIRTPISALTLLT